MQGGFVFYTDLFFLKHFHYFGTLICERSFKRGDKMDTKTKHLVKQAVAGDTAAYGALYELYALDLYRFALSICRNPHDAEDAVQETVLSVYKSIGTLRNKEKFTSYLFTALANTCKRKLKSAKCSVELFENASTDTAETDFQFTYEIKEALFKLEETSRQILVLSVLVGFTSKEIGEMLDMPAATVRTKQKRALEFMRKELAI